MTGPDRRTLAVDRALARSLEQDVLTAHLVITSALNGRTSPDHAARATRRAAATAIRVLYGDSCPACQRNLPARRWIVFKGFPYEVAEAHVLARGRAYCSEHCAVVALLREGWDFLACGETPRHAAHEVTDPATAPDPDITLPPLELVPAVTRCRCEPCEICAGGRFRCPDCHRCTRHQGGHEPTCSGGCHPYRGRARACADNWHTWENEMMRAPHCPSCGARS